MNLSCYMLLYYVICTLTGGLLGRYKQPNGGVLGLAAGIMAVMATASLANQVLWGTRLGAGPSLAWASVGALLVWLTWRYQVRMPVVRLTPLTQTNAEVVF